MSLSVVPLVLTDEDRAGLGCLLESGSPRLAGRARIVLACAEPGSGNSGGGRGAGAGPGYGAQVAVPVR